jgi:hypothetical protein
MLWLDRVDPQQGTMPMTKDEAQREAIRRFRQLPLHQRQQIEDAEAYSKRLEMELDFHTVTNRQKLIAAWLIREIVQARTRGEEKHTAAEVVAFAEDADIRSRDKAAAA